jgi:hypothetical protein
MARNFLTASSMYGSNANAAVTAAPVTLSAWVRAATGTGNNRVVMGVFDTGAATDYFYLMLDASDKVTSVINGASTDISTSTSGAHANNTWCHVCAVFVSNLLRYVYLDGADKQQTTNDRTPSGLDTTAIGARKVNAITRYFQGDIAEPAIWNVALDDAEVAALARGFAPPLIRPASLVAYWPLLGNDSPELDRGKNSYSLTLTNTPTKADHPRIYYPLAVA